MYVCMYVCIYIYVCMYVCMYEVFCFVFFFLKLAQDLSSSNDWIAKEQACVSWDSVEFCVHLHQMLEAHHPSGLGGARGRRHAAQRGASDFAWVMGAFYILMGFFISL